MRTAGRASASGLQLRVAVLWFGQEVVAAAVYRHSHEEYPPSSHTTAPPPVREKRSGKPRQTEILLLGVSDRCRRMRLGTALFEYVRHLAVVHSSQNLLVLYSRSSLGAAAFWSLKLQGHWPAASGDDNQAPRQEPKLLYVSLFNDPGLTLCRLALDTESEAGSLQLLKRATETAELKLQTNVTKATGPPDQLQKGACRPAQPCPISLPASPQAHLDAGVLLGWYAAADKDYYFAEHLGTEQVLERDRNRAPKCATATTNPVHVRCPFVPI